MRRMLPSTSTVSPLGSLPVSRGRIVLAADAAKTARRRGGRQFARQHRADRLAHGGVDLAVQLDFKMFAAGGQFGQRPLANHFAGREDGDAVADAFDFAEHVAVQEDRFALVAQPAEHFADLAAADRIEAVGRLVEHQQVGIVHQRLGQPDALPHSLRVGADLGVRPIRSGRPDRAIRPRAACGRAASPSPWRRRTPASAGRSDRAGSGGVRAGSRRGPRSLCCPIGRPRIVPSARLGRMTVIMILTRVLLPAPLEPNSPKISPVRTCI